MEKKETQEEYNKKWNERRKLGNNKKKREKLEENLKKRTRKEEIQTKMKKIEVTNERR